MSELSQADRNFLALPMDRQIMYVWRALRNIPSRSVGAFRTVAADDTPYVRLADVECTGVIFTNTSGKTLNVKRDDGAGAPTGNATQIPNGSGQQIDVTANANQLWVANGTDGATVTFNYSCVNEV